MNFKRWIVRKLRYNRQMSRLITSIAGRTWERRRGRRERRDSRTGRLKRIDV